MKSKNDDKNKFNLKNSNNKKDYSNNLLKKCQIRYNSFIKEHRDVTMSGTKRFEDKSGEYYLQNMNKFNKNNLNINQKSVTSLKLNNFNSNDNPNYNSNKHMIKVKRKKILDELIPIPTLKQKNKLKNDFEKKSLYNAMGNAKYLRRYQYSNNITQKQLRIYKENQKNDKILNDKVKFIQIWWKTIFQIIKLQKNIRGYLYRIKLISSLDQREEYIDKVIYLVKSIKKIFLYRLLNKLVIFKPGSRYYFRKWKEISLKKVILKKMVNILIINNNKNNFYLTTRFNSNIFKKENDDSDSENEFYKMRQEIIENENDNKSLIDVYTKGIKNKKAKRGKNLSSSSFVLRTTKKSLNIGVELSTSQIINRTKKSLYDLNQTNHNKKNKNNTNNSNNKIISTFDSLKKTAHKRNKSNNNNQPKFNQNKFSTNNKYSDIKENCIKEKSLNDLKNIKVNHNKNNFNNSNNKNMALTKINTDLTKSSNFGKKMTNTESKDDLSKKSLHKKKMHNYAVSNISNHSTNLFNTNNKNKKIKVYENKLNDYNKKINTENNNENQLFSIDKENQQLEKLLPYAESIFDESQFSAFLDNSTLINNKNIYNYSQDNDKFIFNNNKSMKNNSCFDVLSIRNQEKQNNDALVVLKNYFDIWVKKTIFGLLLRKIFAFKNIYLGINDLVQIISYKYFKLFFEKFKDGYSFLILKVYLNHWKLKLFTKRIKTFVEKFKLLKYFKLFKMIIDKKIILQNIIQYEKYIIRKNKGRKKRNREQFYTEYDKDNKYYITDFPISNIINNRYNLNNNTNNCYIINNLNYNNTDNKINIGLSYQNDFPDNNNNSNNLNGAIRSKVIEFPKHIYKQNKIKQSNIIYDKSHNSNIIFNDNINNHKTIDNSNLYNFNPDIKNNNNIMKNNDTNDNYLQNNLSKSVIISNKPSHFEPDLTTQKNQLMMVINIIERHRKSNNYHLFLSCFHEWKNTMNYDPNQNIKLRNKKIIKNQTSFNTNKNDKIVNFSCGTIDNEELTKNTINSEGFPTESDSKSENKISTISNNKLNSKLNSDKNKYSSSSTFDFQENENKNDNNSVKKCFQGVYKKKTIPGSTNKSMSFAKKNSFNHSLNPNAFQLSRLTVFQNDLKIQESIKEDNENDNVIKPLSHKNLNLILQNEEANMNIVNFGYTTPEDYFGFKKVNKIEEMEVSFVPLNEKNKSNNNDNNDNNINENIQEINIEKEDEPNNEDKKEVIIEAIEEYNEYEEDNEKIIKKLKNEFDNYEVKLFYKTIDYFKTNFGEDINKENENEITNKSMINIT